jgi:hypothetical protein
MPVEADSNDTVLLMTKPEARADVLFSEVGGEAVIFDPATQQMHRLDPRARLVWQLLDGTATLDQTCHEIAEAFGAELDDVRRDVAALVHDLQSRGLLAEDEVTAVPPVPAAEVEEQESAFWVPMEMNGCVETVTQLGWPEEVGVEISGHGVCIRAGSAEVADDLRRLLGSNVRSDVEGAFPNLSIRPAEPTDDGMTFARLYTRCTLVGRAKQVEDLYPRLVRELEAQVWRFRADGVRFHGAVLEVEGAAVLAPGPAWARLVPHERSLPSHGVRLIARDVVLDGDTAEVVLPPSGIDLDPDLLGDAVMLDEQRWPIRGWLMETGEPPGLVVPPGRAMMIAQAAVTNGQLLAPEHALGSLTAILNACPQVTYLGEWRTIIASARDCVTRV